MNCGSNYNFAALRLALIAALLKLISLPATAEVSNQALQLCEKLTAITPDRVLLQMPRPQGMTIKWRGSSDVLCLYSHDGEVEQALQAPLADSHYEIALSGLKPDTHYRYSIGGKAVSDAMMFTTAPDYDAVPDDGNVRLLILGDSGTAGEKDRQGFPEHEGEAEAVRDGYFKYAARTATQDQLDLLVLLGDNAYPAGTDHEWQVSFFDVYPSILQQHPVVPTIGNHEMGFGIFNICPFMEIDGCENGPVEVPLGGASQSSDPASYDGNGDGPDGTGPPYMDIFTLPTQAELGGAASETEQYFSMDYGIVHLVSLDSQLSVQDEAQRQAMQQWLVKDLKRNQRQWTVVFFHHPPYSKGENHDSDLEDKEIMMREEFSKIFDAYGVDAVFSGHAHTYERSWYIGGHYGNSGSFDAKLHAEVDAQGVPLLGQGDDPYSKISRITQKDDKVVYTVAGNAGHTTYRNPCREGQLYGCTKPDWLKHPAHRTFTPSEPYFQERGIAKIGSVVVTATSSELRSEFIDQEGEVLDYFIIQAKR